MLLIFNENWKEMKIELERDDNRIEFAIRTELGWSP